MLVTGLLMHAVSAARQAAFDCLNAVENGAFASDALLDHSRALNSRDASLAAQIVFGTLRHQAQLDFLIRHYSGRPAEVLDPAVRLALRTAIFQLRYLDRVPPHAAVDEAVEFTKKHRRAAANLVNAVLRKVDRMPVTWPDLSTELSCPAWMLDRWSGHFGPVEARAIALAALEEPGRYIRIPPGCPAPGGLELEATPVEGCFRVLSGTPPGIRLHDIGSQAIIPLLDLRPGLAYLDVCAAPGNKTAEALETRLSLAVACDISLKRLREMPALCPRVNLDARHALPFPRQFDRIFVDAPCSGTGTLARNPEIKWRVQPQDFQRFNGNQVRMVANATELLAPGGKLVYATCSLEKEENEEVVSAALAAMPGLFLARSVWRLPGRDEGDGFYAALLCR